jgi:membrane protease YdiL (CAAX protease family)
VTLLALAGVLLVSEGVSIELAFLAGPAVGDAVLWVGGPLLAAALGTLLFRVVTGRSVWGERRWRWSDLGWGALFGVAVLVTDVVLGTLFDLVVSEPGTPVQGWIDDAMTSTPLLVALGVSLATPFGEEVVCRGFLLRGFEARTSRWFAVAASSVIFGLLHLENLDPLGWLHVISATLAGVLFALALLRTGHLVAAVTAHVVVNTLYTVLGLLAGGTLFLTVGPDGDLPVVDLDVGACALLDRDDPAALDATSEVDCDGPHDVEVAWVGTLPGGPYPDESPDEGEVAAAADEACLDAFETYVDRDWETSVFDYVPVLPDLDRWEAGERELVCLVVPWEDDELTEPARGSGR